MSIAKYNIGDNCYYVTEKNEIILISIKIVKYVKTLRTFVYTTDANYGYIPESKLFDSFAASKEG